MGKKKLMLLGGLRYLLPVIEAAHKEGYYVITCDYLPENIAHRHSDEYHNVSIIDKEAVLELARELKIDGIMSFAVDPGVVAAAYVQERLGLPSFGPYESVCILQNKDRFRQFLAENGFNVPKAKAFGTIDEALADLEEYHYPVIVKPTDSAGSKGVRKVCKKEELPSALEYAFRNSLSKRIIVEDFIEQRGCSSDSECFSVDGELKFVSFSAQRFDAHAASPYVPAAFSWPSTMSEEEESELAAELQRLLTLLGMRTSVYNVETRVGTDGIPYIMEVSPRGGGNRLAEMLRLSTGVDLIANACRAAVGDPVVGVEQKPYSGCWAEVILHADSAGVFKELQIDESYKENVVWIDLWVKDGDQINSFVGANESLGTLALKFDSQEDLDKALKCQRNWIKINTY